MWGRALAPEQFAESYETNPALENTLAAKAGRVGGGIAGFALEGELNPALPFAQMVSSAASEGGDAAVQAAQDRGETDADKLQAIRDHGAAVSGGYAAATAPLYLAGGKVAGPVAQRLLPGASALARAGLETGVNAASNVAVSALARKLQGGNLLPTGEQLGQDLGAAALHGKAAWEATRKAQAILNGTDEHAAMLGTVATDETIPEATRAQAQQSLNALRDQARQTLGVRSSGTPAPAPDAAAAAPTQSAEPSQPSESTQPAAPLPHARDIPGVGSPPALNPDVRSEGAPSANGGQTVPGGTNPPEADTAGAETPPQAQAHGGTSDAGKANTPGSGAPSQSDANQSGMPDPERMDFNGIAAHPNDNITLKPAHPPMPQAEATDFLVKNALGLDLRKFDVQYVDPDGPQAKNLNVKAVNNDGPANGMAPYEMKLSRGYYTITTDKNINGKILIRLDARLLSNSDEMRRVANHEIAKVNYIQKNIEGNLYPDTPNGRRRLLTSLEEAHQEGLNAMQ
jgi:hypothetical protein